MLPWLHYPAATQHLLPKAIGTGRRERFRGLGNCWGGGLFSAELSSRLGQWPLWETVRKAVLTGYPLCDLCWTALGGPACPSSLNKRGPQNFMSPSPGLWPHFPHSLLLLCLSLQLCFLAGKPPEVIFYLPSWFRSSSEPPFPPAKLPTSGSKDSCALKNCSAAAGEVAQQLGPGRHGIGPYSWVTVGKSACSSEQRHT